MKPEVGMKLNCGDVKAGVIYHKPDRKSWQYLIITECGTLYWINDDFTTAHGAKWQPIQPWHDLKPGDGCKVRDDENEKWEYRVYFGMDKYGRPKTFTNENSLVYAWNYCEPLTPEDLK